MDKIIELFKSSFKDILGQSSIAIILCSVLCIILGVGVSELFLYLLFTVLASVYVLFFIRLYEYFFLNKIGK